MSPPDAIFFDEPMLDHVPAVNVIAVELVSPFIADPAILFTRVTYAPNEPDIALACNCPELPPVEFIRQFKLSIDVSVPNATFTPDCFL